MKIIKQKRKTLSLKVLSSGEVELKVPRYITNNQIHDFISSHSNWIQKKVSEVKKNKKNFSLGEKFFLFGNSYILLNSENGNSKGIYFTEGKLYTNYSNETDIKNALIVFYKKEAKNYIKSRVTIIAKKLGISYNKIRITSARTRWGSCSSQKNLNFSWRLLQAEKEVIDYVIIHELAHLTHMNHSLKFWNLVAEYASVIGLGDVKQYKKYLRDKSSAFSFD